MYLKRIDIQGFKSFANKTSLEFLPEKNKKKSITAIVGPNGSGKSNISDAIKWVMGEQSVKDLRGKKSTDVIFNGSSTKSALSVASVAITLDNPEHIGDIEADELVISRKLYRDGESEYSINGKKVRLVDIHLLLARAQFGQGSYSVVGQGMIDKLLLQSAEERKSFFDEAVGIKEFQMKRRQSWLKLERSKEHVRQITALLDEMSPRMKSLARQVKKLEERKDIELRLLETQEVLYTSLWTSSDERGSYLKNEIEELKVLLTEKERMLWETQELLAGLAKEESQVDSFSALQQSYDAIAKELHQLEKQRVVLEGKMQTEYSKIGKQQLSWLDAKISELKHEKEKVLQERELLEKQKQSQEREVVALEQELTQARERRAELVLKISQKERQLFESKSEEQLWQLGGLHAVEGVLKNQNSFGRVYGAVAQLGSTKKEYQLALDVAAGGQLSSLVVEDDVVAKKAIEFLRQERLGTATFLPLNKIKPRYLPQHIDEILDMPGVHGLAIDLLDFDKTFDTIFRHVFGATIVVESMTVARQVGIGTVRMVTLEGDIIETSGQMKGGYRKKNVQGLSFAQHRIAEQTFSKEVEAELQSYREELDQIEPAYAEIQRKVSAAQMKIAVDATTVEHLQKKEMSLSQELASLEQERQLHSMTEDEYTDAMKQMTSESGHMEELIAQKNQELLVAKKTVDEFHATQDEKKQQVFSLQDTMQQVQQEVNILSEKKHTLDLEYTKVATKLEDLEQDISSVLHLSAPQLLAKQIAPVASDLLHEYESTIQKLTYQLSLIGGIDEEVVEEYEETKVRFDDLTMQLDDLNQTIFDLESLIDDLDKKMKKKHKEAFANIRKEFSRYFSQLFDGGRADLVEVFGYETQEEFEDDADDVAEDSTKKKILKGIDIIACPPGKKINNLHMLSGGERTMTSIALICAILHTNPSPFVVLDEVEAALDEANSSRLNTILSELSYESQFILITHNRTTMNTADTLYGVTMGNDGMSSVVSVQMGDS